MTTLQQRDASAMLDWLMARRVHEYFDVVGRPLGEGRSEAIRLVSTEMRACPYAGSRYHHAKLMNVSALREMPPWPEILTLLSWLATRHRDRTGNDVSSYLDLAQIVGSGIFLADYLVLREEAPLPSGGIPVVISGLVKVCLGFQVVFLFKQYVEEAVPESLPDANALYAEVEAREHLIGDKEVCAGTPAMIMQAYEAMIGNRGVAPEALPPACRELNIDWEHLDSFADHAGLIWRDMMFYVALAPQFLPRLNERNLPADVQNTLNDHLERRGRALLAAQKGIVVDIVRSAEEPMGEPPSPEEPADTPTQGPEPGSLAETVAAWLAREAPVEMRSHGDPVARALAARLAGYEAYEANLLSELNQHLDEIATALGRTPPPERLTASALSLVCGTTLRDWDE